jgi:enamine deaminase RidA (YjgF/YER057c/UK114 family)
VTRRLINPPELYDGVPYSYVASSDQADLLAAWQAVEAEFGRDGPPSTLLGVSVLGFTGQLVEIEAVAAR